MSSCTIVVAIMIFSTIGAITMKSGFSCIDRARPMAIPAWGKSASPRYLPHLHGRTRYFASIPDAQNFPGYSEKHIHYHDEGHTQKNIYVQVHGGYGEEE